VSRRTDPTVVTLDLSPRPAGPRVWVRWSPPDGQALAFLGPFASPEEAYAKVDVLRVKGQGGDFAVLRETLTPEGRVVFSPA
jgi:hypothetical protein